MPKRCHLYFYRLDFRNFSSALFGWIWVELCFVSNQVLYFLLHLHDLCLKKVLLFAMQSLIAVRFIKTAATSSFTLYSKWVTKQVVSHCWYSRSLFLKSCQVKLKCFSHAKTSVFYFFTQVIRALLFLRVQGTALLDVMQTSACCVNANTVKLHPFSVSLLLNFCW